MRLSGSGSSPQAWGTAECVHIKIGAGRFIPTGVGNGDFGRHQRIPRAVHPHRRGERNNVPDIDLVVGGSSPQAWGTGWRTKAEQNYGTVHPHRRGERGRKRSLTAGRNGSSPQAWGTGTTILQGNIKRRFIPTGVGNGKCSNNALYNGAVHPHRRGERIILSFIFCLIPGSSPQAWGTGQILDRCKRVERFIPTGVGNGDKFVPSCYENAVHPHRRGERQWIHHNLISINGSSPQAWGTVSSPIEKPRPARFIPTGVGNGRMENRGG